jgi:hypothetical protein
MFKQDIATAACFQHLYVEYRKVAGFTGYKVGDNGAVWSCRTFQGVVGNKWRKLSARTSKNGYINVVLCRGAGQKIQPTAVHRLVLEAFVGMCPEGMECCHRDGNRSNNSLSNLRWGTHQSNIDDREKHGKTRRGEYNGAAKLSQLNVNEIRTLLSRGVAQKLIAKRFKVSQSAVSLIKLGKKWKAKTDTNDEKNLLTGSIPLTTTVVASGRG